MFKRIGVMLIGISLNAQAQTQGQPPEQVQSPPARPHLSFGVVGGSGGIVPSDLDPILHDGIPENDPKPNQPKTVESAPQGCQKDQNKATSRGPKEMEPMKSVIQRR